MINFKKITNIYKEDSDIKNEFENFIRNDDFPCVAAIAALKRKQIKTYVADNMACPNDDKMY
ncbi:MAG: YqcI/YcgG family protein [Ignavibacteria bacterium]|nr:YqcI/YcgG family protein [Ignavibacteria bacterium]